MNKRISLMIVGAQKSGTTAINQYLSQHPEIFTHFTQEFKMFLDKNSFEMGLEYYLNTCVTNYPDVANSKKFIAKNVGIMYKEEMVKKLFEHNPDVKVVILLRNPIDRAFSAFWYNKSDGTEPYNSFEEAIFENDLSRFNGNLRSQNSCDYIGRGQYYKYLNSIYNIFPENNIRIYIFEDLINNLNKYLNDMCSIIGVENEFIFDTNKRYNEKVNVKSHAIASILEPGKFNYIKKIIPFELRLKVRELIKKFNKGEELGKIPMDTQTRLYLKDIFINEVNKIEADFDIDLKKYWKDFE